MDSSGGITASLQGRYASALYELASEHKAVSTVEADLDRLGQAIAAASDLASLIRNPRLTRTGALAAMTGLGEHLKLSPLTQKFLGVLSHNRRLSALPQIVSAFAGNKIKTLSLIIKCLKWNNIFFFSIMINPYSN